MLDLWEGGLLSIAGEAIGEEAAWKRKERCHMQKDAMNKESLRFSLNLRLDPSLVSLTFFSQIFSQKTVDK